MRTRLTSSHFVGRAGELAELEQAVREAASRRPVLVLLGGESGVGKTRLIAELERRLDEGALGSDESALLLRGEAVEQAEGELPYAPLLGALRPLVRSRNPALDTLGRGSRAQLAALLPGLDDGGPQSDRDDPSAQLRLFEALLELLDCLSETQPVVLVLEDMHWADRSTRTFVSFLARSLRDERVMLLISYRADELHRRHALRPLLAELDRLERARRLELDPLDREELAEVLRDILGEEPRHELVERLYARSEGNPLYTEELLAAGLDGRGAAPQTLRDAFMLRIERLSEDAQAAVRAIAVGRALDEETIAEVIDIEHEALHAALREAVAEQVLCTGQENTLCFRHALLREAVYDDLLPGERSELHLQLARALEERIPRGEDAQAQLTATIASHYSAAGDQPAALRATVQAALAARDVLALGEAADLAERALELWPRVAEAQEMLPLDHVELLSLAASAHGIAGDRSRAEVLWRSALAELDPDAEPRRYSEVLGRLARVQWSLNRGMEGVETAKRALSLLPSGEPSRERASLLAWLARTQHLRGRYREALRDGEEALAEAIAAGDRQSESEVLNTLGSSQITLGQVDEGKARLLQAVEIARETDDVDGVVTAYTNLSDMLNLAGRTAEAVETAKEALKATPRRLTRSFTWVELTLSDASFEAGDWKAARAYLERPREHLAGIVLIFHHLREAELALGEGDEETASRCLEELEPLVASSSEPQWIGAFGTLMGELRRRRHELLEARAAVAHALDRMEVCTDDVMRIARVSATGARVEADIAQRARDLREKAQERDAVTRTRIHVQRLRAAAQEGGPVESAWRAVGAAELARARGRDDPALWVKAAGEWEAMARPYQTAMCRWRAAEAFVPAGDREAAAAAAADALRVAERLGSRWLRDEVTALAERARLELAPDGRPAVAEPAAPEDPFGLTPRERQVLALIAEGATNRQIGAALFMAEKTASVHVSRILSKLDVQTRTQAAAVAHRLRLD
jgi:DNA-binding CsgD family transcriptional regulator/tetratricopeptide (TPR) repeat protein